MMATLDLETCATFVAANRLIAERLRSKAEELLESAQSIDDIEERLRIADLVQSAERRAELHIALSQLQERDMGVKCHCGDAERMRGNARQSL